MAGATKDATMLAVVKAEAAPGAEVRQVKVPGFGRSDVLVKVKVASICGTDLHIYNWDRWAQNRIHPPLIPGHEFCGEVVAFGNEVTSVKEGDFVSAEMHVACGKCLQCRTGEAHICQNVKIIGVDANGAFAEYVVIPESNIWKLDPAIPQEYASILDPLGNAVHTVLAGEIAAILFEKAFHDLDGPLVRVASLDTPVPYAPTLEEAFLPNAQKVFTAAKELARF